MWNVQARKAAEQEAPRSGFRGTLLRSPAQSGRSVAPAAPGRGGAGGRVAPSQGRAGPPGGAGARGGRRAEPQEVNPVVAFLAEIDMLQYAEAMLENGFDDLETLMEMEDLDMLELGMPRGHVIKLRRRLRHLGGVEPAEPQPELQEQHQVAPVASAPSRSRETPKISEARYGPQSALVVQTRPDGQQISAVQLSWETVKQLGTDHVGLHTYKNLFEIAPESVKLFPREVRARYQSWTCDEGNGDGDIMNSPALSALFGKVINAVGNSVAGMGDTEALVPKLRMLGMRHLNHKGVTEAHFPLLLRALIMTLRSLLGELFTAEVEFAWGMVYNFLAAIMCEGLKEAQELQQKAIRSATSTEYAESSPTGSRISAAA